MTTDDARPPARAVDPAGDGNGLDDLYDIARLARRLDVEHATIRVWLSRKVPWLPPPDGRLNGGAVWRATTLEGIEQRRFRRRPGRKPRFTVAPAAADVPRTGSIPVVTARTGAIPVVPPRTGAIPVVTARTGAVPVVTSHTGAIPVVPPRTGAIPVVPPRTGAIPVVPPGTPRTSRRGPLPTPPHGTEALSSR
ncbi:hypothetical protein LFM56_15460 [Cellulomonas iranensis]|uniref:hypothetical protein n=1 Tax=Cellulomonas iranensis TaxID=76862 RepID=UPI001CF4C145|nr:hypothetical protein [Cellulomonas iranensis]UCN14257.1 hypothetical protein LFM56_15460 [Cellulomonas iranensis]